MGFVMQRKHCVTNSALEITPHSVMLDHGGSGVCVMSTFMSREVREGLEAARIAGLKKASRLRVMLHDGNHIPVLSLWKNGFSVDAAEAPALRGLVDVYDGAQHLYQCLIVASEEEFGEMRYEFKRSTEACDTAPLDFYRNPLSPVAFIGQG